MRRLARSLSPLFVLLAVAAAGRAAMAAKDTAGPPDEAVFIGITTGAPMPMLDVRGGKLRIRDVARWLPDRTGYAADGARFPMDWDDVQKRYAQLSVEKRLRVEGGALLFDDRPVALPRGVAMRAVWQAVLWKGWVAIIGRTSQTDAAARLRPPSIAAELVVFAADDLTAQVRYLSPHAPTDVQIHVLKAGR
jgi:hypothetical protein